ncbi:hypothetical protein GQ44DRAFT_775293 [Phaeosphaeriaceae sp. PMI808]|nr:hypothetical protein GQ44DRAFT_775293 [Phaeosphaeriaceae sp. PMI808]
MSSRARANLSMLAQSGDLSPFDKVQRWIDIISAEGYDGHDAEVFKILKLESVTSQPTKADPHNSRTVFSFTVPRQLCNMTGNLHGGAVALLFDISTSVSITAVSREGFWDTGQVSRNRKFVLQSTGDSGTVLMIFV